MRKRLFLAAISVICGSLSTASANQNLVFNSLPPCIAFDTRPASGGTGAFAVDETRYFNS